MDTNPVLCMHMHLFNGQAPNSVRKSHNLILLRVIYSTLLALFTILQRVEIDFSGAQYCRHGCPRDRHVGLGLWNHSTMEAYQLGPLEIGDLISLPGSETKL